ncbi:hypothetical protein AAL_04737 [Moelleriella libera RCEF 2490]|uniref:Uncharacterized protein n=1 Tax=Moelleriella libera RCEF 2490 TaxID=1081109 RepID=A0A168BMW7_9HYPO|nr:hypothetical protein AAL_04737 [Moelleriella libera RCEF 2490]
MATITYLEPCSVQDNDGERDGLGTLAWKYSRAHEKEPFKVVGRPAVHDAIDDQGRHGEDNGLKRVKLQRHWLPHDPAHDDEKGRDEERDLQGGADNDGHGEVDAVGLGPLDGADQAAGVADDGHDDEADEAPAHAEGLDEAVDAVDQGVGAKGDAERGQHEHDAAGEPGELVGGRVLLLVEQVRVRDGLEVEVDEVEDEQDDGGDAREEQHVLAGVVVGAVVGGVRDVQRRGQDERHARDDHERGQHAGDVDVDVDGGLVQPREEEADAENLRGGRDEKMRESTWRAHHSVAF